MNNAPTPFEEDNLLISSSKDEPTMILTPSLASLTKTSLSTPQTQSSNLQPAQHTTISTNSSGLQNTAPASTISSKQHSLPVYQEYYAIIHRIIAGFIGGAAGIIVGQPWDLIKVRLQAGIATGSAWQTGLEIFKKEGITAFWRGVIPPLASVAPLNALGFTSYHKGLDLLTTRFGSPVASRPPRPIPSATPEQLATLVASLQRDISPSITADFIKRNSTYTDTTPLAHRPDLRYAFAAGCISGLLSVLIAVPAEFVKVQEQNSAVHRSPYIVARDIVKAHGWRALYRGFWATAWRDFPSVGLYFWSYEYVKWYFRHETLVPKVVARQPTSSSNFDIPISVDWQYTTKPTTAGILTAGGIAGALSWASTYPFDIMKTQIQSLSHREYLKHGRIIDVYRQIVQQKGHKFFLAGGLTTIVRAVPVNAVTFYCFEETSAFLKRQRFCMGPPEAYAQ